MNAYIIFQSCSHVTVDKAKEIIKLCRKKWRTNTDDFDSFSVDVPLIQMILSDIRFTVSTRLFFVPFRVIPTPFLIPYLLQ